MLAGVGNGFSGVVNTMVCSPAIYASMVAAAFTMAFETPTSTIPRSLVGKPSVASHSSGSRHERRADAFCSRYPFTLSDALNDGLVCRVMDGLTGLPPGSPANIDPDQQVEVLAKDGV
ncbi:hypothetical protein E2C06_29010 [Dankookia rubra]|uniref:Uncharacterized protein n=1 Tax=Dankookia rubra TaxID=1442381 RepID=A0A4R5Q9F0_9PROT|nr:hypothetical protein [Dankookia rubra]TDH59138.1 hypothetical protein E2C06_29010 [Dankookia rubra]